MRKVKVMWVGLGKVLPRYGLMEVGRLVNMGAEDAESYISQGMAEGYIETPESKKPKRKKGDV